MPTFGPSVQVFPKGNRGSKGAGQGAVQSPVSEVEDFSVDEAKSIVRDSLKLIGNTSATISKMQRKRVLKALNPALQEMADDP